MSLFVDTSVWSLAFRRDGAGQQDARVERLSRALSQGELVMVTGLILQELLQGFSGPKDRDAIIARFRALPLLVPDLDGHIRAAELRNHCRRNGVQVGTIDALLAELCVRYDLLLLTADQDFTHMAQHSSLKLA